MKIVYDPVFVKQIRRVNVRVRKSAKSRFLPFSRDPNNPVLNNHSLSRGWKGYRSIDITSDCRAIYEEVDMGEKTVAYFVALGTHEELYKA